MLHAHPLPARKHKAPRRPALSRPTTRLRTGAPSVESMLREIAFVLHATRRVRQAIEQTRSLP